MKGLIENNFIAGLLKSSYELKFFDYNSQVYVDYLNSTLAFLKKNKLLFYILLVLKHDASFIHKYKISIKFHYYDLCQGNDISLEIIAGYLISLFTFFLENDLELNIQNLDKYLQIMKKLIDSLKY